MDLLPEKKRVPGQSWYTKYFRKNSATILVKKCKFALLITFWQIHTLLDKLTAQLYWMNSSTIPRFLTKLYVTQSFAIASTVTQREIRKNFSNSVQENKILRKVKIRNTSRHFKERNLQIKENHQKEAKRNANSARTI